LEFSTKKAERDKLVFLAKIPSARLLLFLQSEASWFAERKYLLSIVARPQPAMLGARKG